MTYEELKKKHPDWNWEEAEEILPEDLEAAAEKLDIIKNPDKYFKKDEQKD